MTKRYILDTNILIDLFHGRESAVDLMKKIKGESLFISVIVVAEIYHGIFLSNNKNYQLRYFEDFLADSGVGVIDLGKAVAIKYGEIKSAEAKKGIVGRDFDLLIAATAIINDLVLVTRNVKDFKEIKGLKLYKG